MKTKHLLMLVAILVAVILLSIWLQRERTISSEAVNLSLLAPELTDGINNVEAIRIVKPGNKTVISIVRIDDGWMVKEKYDYSANVGKIRELLLQLSLAKIIEQKTSNPDLYKRLGVQDIEIENGDLQANQLEIDGLAEPVRLIIGGAPADTADATYVRRAGEAASWLINTSVDVDDDPLNWLDRTVIDVPPERVYRISISPKDGVQVVLQKTSSDESEFALQNIPQGREQSSGFMSNSVAAAIAGLSFDDVAPASQVAIAENSQGSISYETFDGLVINAELFVHQDVNYARFNVSTDSALAKQLEQGGEALAIEEVEKQAAALNKKLSDWAYVIPAVAYESITKSLEDFLTPVEGKSGENKTDPGGTAPPP